MRARPLLVPQPGDHDGFALRLLACIRRAAWLSPRYIPAADFTPHDNPADLGRYLWNEQVLNNYFCKSCGIFVYIADGENGKDGYRVNLGCVAGLDVFALEVKRIAGSALPVVGH